MMREPIVAWSAPVIRASRTMYLIGEELELGSRAKAEQLLREHLGHVRDLIAFLQANPTAGRKP